MLRVIRELRPTWVVGENVVGLIKLGLDEVLTDLEGEGYATRTFNIPACATGAPHLRHRIWVVAHADSESEPDGTFDGNARQRQLGFEFVADPDSQRGNRAAGKQGPAGRKITSGNRSYVADADDQRGQERHAQRPEQDRQEQTGDAVSRGSSVADSGHTDRRRGTKRRQSRNGDFELHGEERPANRPEEWWELEPDVGRLADGLPNRVSQLRALGNSIVPQIAQEIGQAIRVAHHG